MASQSRVLGALVLMLCADVSVGSTQAPPAHVTIPLLSREGEITVVAQDGAGLTVEYAFSRLDCREVQTERGAMTLLSIPGLSHTTRAGIPKLPSSRRIICVPLDASVNAEILHAEVQEIRLGELGLGSTVLPAQPPVSKRMSPADVPFVFDEAAYAASGFDGSPVASVEELGILRGLRLFTLVVEPVKYDPVGGRILVHNDLRVNVTFHGGNRVSTDALRASTWSPYFESMYRRSVLNYQAPARRSDLTRYPVKYVIIADPMFATQLQPFIQWKMMKGFDVVAGYVGDPAVGSTTASIKAFIQGIYEAATPSDPAPSFVLFVGDVAQIPAWPGLYGQHVTDLHYVTLEGVDLMPEIYFGRFSANTPSELQPQIDKTLEYERFQMEDPSYLGEAVMIAGMDPNFAQVWANGQINYGTAYYFNEQHGIESHTYLYPASGSHEADIITDVSNGVGYANYTAHGSEYAWADPGFQISDIQGLTNAHRYPTVVGNCCLTNSFQINTCFGEAWLRAEGKGAVGYVGATNSSLWNEDYWWGVGAGTVVEHPTYEATGPGAYDGMFHDNGELFPDWYTTQYAFIMAGCLAVVEAGSPETEYYWEIYALMGDPSLSTYFGVPAALAVDYPGVITVGETSLNVVAEPWSYVGLSREGSLLAAGLADASGQVTLEFDPVPSPGPLCLVVTRQNRVPSLLSVSVVPSDGPWVETTAVQWNDASGGNGNGHPEFGETLLLTLTERNIGTAEATGVEVLISSVDPYFAIVDSTEWYGDIPAGQDASVPDAFLVTLAPDVPDNHVIRIDVTATDDQGHLWPDYFDVTALAPVLVVTATAVDDAAGNANGILDPGETAGLDIWVTNSGGADAGSVAAILSSNDSFITIGDSPQTLGQMAPGDTAAARYAVTADAGTPPGHLVWLYLQMSGVNYSAVDSFSLSVGTVVEDFESGGFTLFPWVMGGDAPWTITSTGPYEGSYAAVSGDIGDSQSSELMMGLTVLEAGAISFYYRVSSEPGYDFFRFLIDGQVACEASGTVGWTEAQFDVGQGTHTLTWSYDKDYSVSNGSDCAWVDYIIFPAMADSVAFPDIDVDPASLEVSVLSGQTVTEPLMIANAGGVDLTYTVSVTTGGTSMPLPQPGKRAKGEAELPPGEPVSKGWGGPDGHGYRWRDSDEPDGPSYQWIDISSAGTSPGQSDDGNYGPFDLGFPFEFYGVTHTTIRICTNGWLSFTSSATALTNQEIPSPTDPNDLIAPFWDDLDPSSGGAIYYLSDPSNGRFIVQWDHVPRYSSNPDTASYTFQAIVSADGRITYQYCSLSAPVGSCTVGIEDGEGMDGLQIAYNQVCLHDSLAILIEPGDPWLNVTPSAGTVAPYSAETLGVTFSSVGLLEGDYEGTIVIRSNDPDEPSIAIPVRMSVAGVATDEDPALPGRFTLEVTPNPFTTSCRFATGHAGTAPDLVRIYDVRGNLVWEWVRPHDGSGPATWVPGPSSGSGVYVARATLGDQTRSKGIIYLR